MASLDLSTKCIDGGYFVLGQSRRVPYVWETGAESAEQFLGTYCESGAPIREALLRMLREAKHHVCVASFLLGDEELIEALIALAGRLRGGVYVICALDGRSLRRGLEEYGEDIDESPEERRKNFERLTSRGVYVRGHENCHAKFAIADDRLALLGSANFVKNAFEWTGEANIQLTNPTEVRRLKGLFTALWYEGCKFEIPPGEQYQVADRAPETSPLAYPQAPVESGSVVWTDGAEHTSLLAAIRQVIQRSERELVLSSYSIVGMAGHPELVLDEILAARRRGVEIRLFVRQRNAFQGQRQDLELLHQAGVQVFADTRNHAKVAIGDQRDAVLFSANLDAQHGLDSGVEVGYRLSDPLQIARLSRYMDHAITQADTRYVYRPALGALDGKLAARWCSAWPHEQTLALAPGSNLPAGLDTAECLPPALFEERTDGVIRIWIGDALLEVRVADNTLSEAVIEQEQGKSSGQRFEEWLKSANREFDATVVRRGIFAGTLNT